MNFLNLYGYRWHARAAGFGEQRASQVVAWLRMQYEYPSALGCGHCLERGSGLASSSVGGRAAPGGGALIALTPAVIPQRLPIACGNRSQLLQALP